MKAGKALCWITAQKKVKAQTAIEYLITHAWSILTLGVVLVFIFSLGVFSGTFNPTAAAGSCSVLRPLGPGSTTAISLQGECSGLQPKFVTAFPESSTAGSYVLVPNSNLLNPPNTVTVTAWVYVSPQIGSNPDGTTDHFIISKGSDACVSGAGSSYSLLGGSVHNNDLAFCVYTLPSSNIETPVFLPSQGEWYFVAGTYNGISACLYINGTLYGCKSATGGIRSTTTALGIATDVEASGPSRMFNGTLSNIQVYNTSLSSNAIYQLYLEGIGGSPINLQKIVGWWPLNGDVNDYSGNNNNGQAFNSIKYTSSWHGGYYTP